MSNIHSFFYTSFTSSPPPPSSHAPSSPPQNEVESGSPSASAISYPSTWKPPAGIPYVPTPVSGLRIGVSPIFIAGRISNLASYPTTSEKPTAAKNSLRLTVSDHTGAVDVKLWHSTPLPGQETTGKDGPPKNAKKNQSGKMRAPEKPRQAWLLKLGMRVVIYTTSVAALEPEKQAAGTVPYQIILTEWDEACRIVLYRPTDETEQMKRNLRIPIGACPRKKELTGLTRLSELRPGMEAKVLVCVRSVGPLKSVTLKAGTVKEKIEIGVFDDSVSGFGKALFLTLWGVLAFSAQDWIPNETVLLLTNTTVTDWKGTKQLAMGKKALVDVDPELRDSIWLRSFAKKQLRSQAVGTPFPGEDVFEWEKELSGTRILYSLADVDEFSRKHPAGQCIGFLSLVIAKMNLVSLYKKNMLYNATCCTLPQYTNNTRQSCKQCDRPLALLLNPHIFETLSDETGSIRNGKLLVSDKAWTSFFCVEPAKLVETLSLERMHEIEAIASFARITCVFGWDSEVGKIAIWDVTP